MATPIGRCRSSAAPSATAMRPSESSSGCWSHFAYRRRQRDGMSMFVTSRIAKDALGVAALLAAAALVGWHCSARMIRPEAPQDSAHTAAADFRDVMYYPARAVLAGVNPYDGSANNPHSYANRFPAGNNFPLYSPLIFVPALPLAVLPLETSVVIWWLFTVGLTVVLAYVAWQWARTVPTIAMTTGL